MECYLAIGICRPVIAILDIAIDVNIRIPTRNRDDIAPDRERSVAVYSYNWSGRETSRVGYAPAR